MVAGLNPVKLLTNVPVPDPVVTLNVDEPELVPQTIPLAETAAPPSVVIVPPLVADVDVMDVADVVAEMLAVFKVVKLVCAP